MTVPLSTTRGRFLIVLAAILWSTSGAFTKVLTKETVFHLNEPAVAPLQMACARVLFSALFFLPFLRKKDLSFRPLMPVMVLSFAVMNATFVSAMALGTAANAILLQYTAPMWMFLASIWWLGERADFRNLAAILLGLGGVAVIVVGGWDQGELSVIGLGLGSGLTYAAVILCLRVLRGESTLWLTLLNHGISGLILLPFVYHLGLPTPAQLLVLFFYGVLQMGVPYLLMAIGLRRVSPQEAGTLTLLEPLLNPLWTYLMSGEKPSGFTFIGGGFILAALAWRYWPRKSDKSSLS